MLSPEETMDGLRIAQARIRTMAWALSIHVPGGTDGGGAAVVEREGAFINGLIESAIDRIKTDAAERE
jgi:hypothetical protein